MTTVPSIFLVLIFLIRSYSFYLISNDHGYHNFKHIVDTTTQLANENFNFRWQTVVISNDVDGIMVDNFLKKYKGTVVIEVKRDGLPPQQVVIFVKSLRSFRKILKILKPDLKGKSLLHSGAKFIIVLLSQSHPIEGIFRTLWSYYVINVIVITNHKENTTALYTFYPYKNYMDCQNTKPFLLGLVDKNNPVRMNVYPDKMKNMRECPLYISTNKLYHSSTEQKLPLQIIKNTMLCLLKEILNFTPIISTSDYVSIDSDRAQNRSDSLNDVITGKTNITTSSISLGVERLGLLDYSFPYFGIRIVWLAPSIKPGHVWLRLLSPLSGYMWLILSILIFFLKSLPFMLKMRSVKKFTYKHFRGMRKLKSVSFRIWAVLVGQPITVSPKRFRDFYIIGLWIWFTFVVRSAYQSVLIGALKTDTVIGNFASLQEAVENGYKFGGRAGILVFFEHDPQIRDEFEVIPEARFEDSFKDVVEGNTKFVFAIPLEYAWAYCLSQGINENECGHVLSDSIMTVPLVVWTKKDSPFMRPLSMWLQRFLESGLLERDTVKPVTVKASRVSSDPTPLTGKQTVSCFLFLLIGYFLCIFVFCLENLKIKLLPKN